MDEKKLEEILKAYQEELADLQKRRAERAERHSKMTEEEIIAEMASEYQEVLEDAQKEGVEIITIPTDEE